MVTQPGEPSFLPVVRGSQHLPPGVLVWGRETKPVKCPLRLQGHRRPQPRTAAGLAVSSALAGESERPRALLLLAGPSRSKSQGLPPQSTLQTITTPASRPLRAAWSPGRPGRPSPGRLAWEQHFLGVTRVTCQSRAFPSGRN